MLSMLQGSYRAWDSLDYNGHNGKALIVEACDPITPFLGFF